VSYCDLFFQVKRNHRVKIIDKIQPTDQLCQLIYRRVLVLSLLEDFVGSIDREMEKQAAIFTSVHQNMGQPGFMKTLE